ncbi:MAG: NapC/NirT family cytochrome c [Candidatus Acidiferrales bacterium]|jgi:nitrate/TMAO reductase-like tetraheme cytochrome c subunit
MFGPTGILIAVIVLTMVLAVFFLIRPAVTAGAREKILAFIALFILPALCIGGGMSRHMERSEQTRFCISCHAMAPYGQSLYVDDAKYLPAAHFQNHRIPVETACYACHANYTIYGPLKDKLQGISRIYVQYVSTPPKTIHIRGGYSNLQCLRCHAGARNFEANPVHQAIMDSLKSNQMSCVSSGCHDTVHNVAAMGNVKFWSSAQ